MIPTKSIKHFECMFNFAIYLITTGTKEKKSKEEFC